MITVDDKTKKRLSDFAEWMLADQRMAAVIRQEEAKRATMMADPEFAAIMNSKRGKK